MSNYFKLFEMFVLTKINVIYSKVVKKNISLRQKFLLLLYVENILHQRDLGNKINYRCMIDLIGS